MPRVAPPDNSVAHDGTVAQHIDTGQDVPHAAYKTLDPQCAVRRRVARAPCNVAQRGLHVHTVNMAHRRCSSCAKLPKRIRRADGYDLIARRRLHSHIDRVPCGADALDRARLYACGTSKRAHIHSYKARTMRTARPRAGDPQLARCCACTVPTEHGRGRGCARDLVHEPSLRRECIPTTDAWRQHSYVVRVADAQLAVRVGPGRKQTHGASMWRYPKRLQRFCGV